MKFYDFKYLPSEEYSIHFLNESHQIVPQHEAKRAIVKKRNLIGGFKEFFIVLNNPAELDVDRDYPIPNLHLDEEELDDGVDPYYLYGLDKILYLKEQEKTVPIFTDHSFVELVPRKFGDVERTLEEICISSVNNRKTIYEHYKSLFQDYVKTLTDVNATTVAYLYEYLNPGEKWVIGMEFCGYVDGLWLEDCSVRVTIDSPDFDLHTASHEMGHAVSYYLTDDLFNEYYDIVISLNEEPITEYARTECSEDFAETFGFYFSGEPADRDMLKKICPERFSFMERLEKLKDNAFIVTNFEPSIELTKRFKLYDAKVYS